MEDRDRGRFVREFAARCSANNWVMPTALGLEVWWRDLLAYRCDDVIEALGRATIDFLPTVRRVQTYIDGTKEDQAMTEWLLVLDRVRGGDRTTKALSPAAVRAIACIGGMSRLGQARDRDLPFIARDFVGFYRPELPPSPPAIPHDGGPLKALLRGIGRMDREEKDG